MTENEKREFDHLVNGIKLIIKMHDDTPPHGRFGLPQFQMEAIQALVKQLEAQDNEIKELKGEVEWRESSLGLFRSTEAKLAQAIKAKCQETVELKEIILKLESELESIDTIAKKNLE